MDSSVSKEYIPAVPQDLLEFLEKRIPAKDFSPSTSLREIDFYMGQRETVRFLKRLYEDQLSHDFL